MAVEYVEPALRRDLLRVAVDPVLPLRTDVAFAAASRLSTRSREGSCDSSSKLGSWDACRDMRREDACDGERRLRRDAWRLSNPCLSTQGSHGHMHNPNTKTKQK